MKFAAAATAIFPLLSASSIFAVESTAARKLQTATYTPGDFSEGLKIDTYVC